MILSFAWTTEQFIAGAKTVSRRDWSERTLRTWQKAWDEGRLEHDAWSRIPIAGGKRIGRFRLTKRPYLEALKDMPHEDLAAEGFEGRFHSVAQYIAFIGLDPEKVVSVIRFVKVEEENGLDAPYQ